ncbi:MAG: GNAT family N-acetyltransferase [candidate division Zixibacteria bacterium]|nr:GNAT family N-acetyltransferase [candidate division Zixibacteria bacterium]
MAIRIEKVGADRLPEYGEVPIAFEVNSILRVDLVDAGRGGMVMYEERLGTPYVKDYDAYKTEGPVRWTRRFDISNWGFFLALDNENIVGGAAVAIRTPGVHMLRGRSDLAVLWDIRVRPEARLRGVGTALFRQAVRWSSRIGCRQLNVETQNINVPACRFYARMGCQLTTIDRDAYAADSRVVDEVQLIWSLRL